MASQAQKNTISLKGSSKMICDFLDYGTVNTLRFILEFHALVLRMVPLRWYP